MCVRDVSRTCVPITSCFWEKVDVVKSREPPAPRRGGSKPPRAHAYTCIRVSPLNLNLNLTLNHSITQSLDDNSILDLNQVVRDHVRNVGLTVVKDLQSKGGMDVSDDDGLRDDLHLLPAEGGKPNVTSDDVVAAMLEVRRCRVHLCRGVVPGVGRLRGGLGGDGTC